MLWKIAVALWFKKPIPVLNEQVDLEPRNVKGAFWSLDMTRQEEVTMLVKNFRQQEIIKKQQEVIENMHTENIWVARAIAVISLSIWFVIWWVALTISGQNSPTSKIQEVASLVSKIISWEKTWYETITESSSKIVKLEKELSLQQEITDLNKKNQSTQEEILKEKDKQLELITWRISVLEEDFKLIQSQIWNPKAKEVKLTSKKEVKNIAPKVQDIVSPQINPEIYNQVTSNIKELNKELPDGLVLKVTKTSDGHINVWSEFGKRRTIWYYADSPKFKDRLSKEAMKAWVMERYDNHLLIWKIETVALSKWAWLSKNDKSIVYIEIKELFSWLIKVIIKDKGTGKDDITLFNSKRDNSDTVSKEMDKILNGFLS